MALASPIKSEVYGKKTKSKIYCDDEYRKFCISSRGFYCNIAWMNWRRQSWGAAYNAVIWQKSLLTEAGNAVNNGNVHKYDVVLRPESDGSIDVTTM